MLAVILLSIGGVVAAATNDLSCGDHYNGDIYPVSTDSCSPAYYQCDNGYQITKQCGPLTVFNPDNSLCDYPENVASCSAGGITGCADADGNSIDGLSYTEVSDCSEGYYYKCENGTPNQYQCPSGQTFDTGMQMCYYYTECESTSVDTPESSEPIESTTTIAPVVSVDPGNTVATPKATPGTPGSPSYSTDAPTAAPGNTAGTPGSTNEVVEPSEPTELPSSTTTGKPNQPTEEATSKTTTITSTTTTTVKTTTINQGITYVGFVVDDTGSMSVEITAVQEWIQDCVSGTNPQCGASPTGGWLVVSFNDPDTGNVVGPTLDAQEIIDEIDSYYAHGGGDCPEMAMTGIEKLASAVPDGSSDCKIYMFTDATAKDDYKEGDVTALLQNKNCKFVPILTGCCGTCPPACDSVSPEYCEDHVTDDVSSSTRSMRLSGTYSSSQTSFYTMSEETGGNIYVTDKPSSPDEMLEFLDEEVTLGFCPTSDIAGPSPNGYECEADCQAMGMCWDKSASTCYCNGTCVYSAMPHGYSYCDGAQHVECDPDVPIEIVPDMTDCHSYFECYYGSLYHFTCANGTIYSEASTSHCDYEDNVPPPCGSDEGNVVTMTTL